MWSVLAQETSASPVDLGPVQSTLRDMRGQAEAQALWNQS